MQNLQEDMKAAIRLIVVVSQKIYTSDIMLQFTYYFGKSAVSEVSRERDC